MALIHSSDMKPFSRSTKYSLLAILIILSSAVIYQAVIPGEKDSFTLISNGTSAYIEAPTARNWVDIQFERQPLHTDITDSIYRGMSLQRYGDLFYISDFGDMKIKRFDTKGRFVDSFGKGEGRGPGEFTLILGYTLIDDVLYVQDARKFEVLRFDNSSGEYINSFKIEYQPHRLISVGDNLVAQALFEEHLFQVHNKKGELLSNFGSLIEDQVKNSLSVQGEMVPLPNGDSFVFVPAKASYILYFNLKGDQVRTVITPDRIRFPETEYRESGDVQTFRAASPDKEVDDIKVHDVRLYVLLNENDSEANSIVDIYNLETGEYIHSIRLPVIGREILVIQDLLYLIDKETEQVKAYKMIL